MFMLHHINDKEVGAHTNIGTWTPSHFATLLVALCTVSVVNEGQKSWQITYLYMIFICCKRRNCLLMRHVGLTPSSLSSSLTAAAAASLGRARRVVGYIWFVSAGNPSSRPVSASLLIRLTNPHSLGGSSVK